ncbi:MAG: tetratricopeptide repeat protein [Deltaproteobacteria bacterium]|nr:tetratricopeptide repeat protein [Deltaproteobacteria bacterium]MCL4873077.1 tetratricopeptide repeat protein [bacterium]
MPDNRKPENIILIAALLSAIAAFALYLPSLGFDFVNWDDQLYVYENPRLQGPGLKWAFTSVILGTWVPVTFLSLSLDYALWGLNPLGYHLTNSALHAANVFLVALLAARLAGTRGSNAKALFIIAISAGLLFGLHPLRVESVAWISERKDVLNAFFFLLGVLSYLGYAKTKKASSYVLTLVFFVLSLLSKPMTVTMPLVLLILDLYPLGRHRKDGWKRLIIEKLPFIILSLAAVLATMWSQTMAMVPAEELAFGSRLHIAARGYLFYIYKTLVPVNLAPVYPRDFAMGPGLFALYVLALSALTALAILLRRRSWAFIAVWAYFVITLIPVIGLVQVGMQAAADRYTYIPGMGIAVLVAAGAGRLAERKKGAFAPVLAVIIAASALLSILALKQISVWKDSFSLWNQQIRLFPDHPYGYVNRGNAYLVQGRLDLAMEDLGRITPDTASGFMNRANAYISLGKFDLAIENLDRAIELGPVSTDAYMKRGGALVNAGRFEEGIADLTFVLDGDPRNKDAYRARGVAHAISGQYGKAVEDFKNAVLLDPADPSAHIDLGKAYMHLGDSENSYLSMKRAHDLGDPAASRYLKDLEAQGPGK